MSAFLHAGEGSKGLLGDKNNKYVVDGSWLASGLGIKMGMEFYP